MKKEDLDRLEKVTGNLEGLHRELSVLAKKSTTDGLNSFKLKLVNAALDAANQILTHGYRPIEGFEQFDPDDVPSNSDATVVLTVYLEELERYRSDQVTVIGGVNYYVFTDGEKLRASAPRRLARK